ELTAIEAVEQGARLTISGRASLAVLQLPLAGRLIVGHLDDEDHVGRMVDELARLKKRSRLGDGLAEVELGRAIVGADPHRGSGRQSCLSLLPGGSGG